MQQMSRLHGRACKRMCGFTATKLSRLESWEDGKIDRWCRTQASSHSSQSVVDVIAHIDVIVVDVIANLSTAATRQDRRTLLLNGPGLGWLFATLLLQLPSQNQHVPSRVRRLMSTFCELTRAVGDR